MWIEHMYAYLANPGTLGTFSCFSLEGSLVRVKRNAAEQEGG